MVIIVVSSGALIEIVEDCQSKAICFCNLFNLFKSRKGKKRKKKRKKKNNLALCMRLVCWSSNLGEDCPKWKDGMLGAETAYQEWYVVFN